jgi:plasmid segregation protein ParM
MNILAIDVGFGNTKAVWNRRRAAGHSDQWSEICFRSVTPRVVVESTGAGLGSIDRVVVPVGDDRFYVGPKATYEGGTRALHPDYINTPEHEALLCGAWHYMLKATGELNPTVDLLVLGLPVSGFQANRRRLQEIGSKMRRVPVPHALRDWARRDYIDVVAKKVMVMPQPMGGLILAARQSNTVDLFGDGNVSLVIDPGYNTFDWFVANGMNPQLELCGSFQGGVSQLLQAVSTQIGFDHGEGSVNFGLVEQALKVGEMNLGHKRFSMAPYQKVVKNAATGVISEFLQRFNPAKAGISRIYLCGGGALHYADALKARLPGLQIEVMADSVMANVRGFWLAGADSL